MSTLDKNLTLYSNHLTPNGLKVSIYLEELKAADPTFDYKFQPVDLAKNEQKEPWFIKLNPNGRIPVLVDHSRDDFPVFESAAILLYLEQYYDKEKRFSFDPVKNPKEHSSMIQWILFSHGGISPMQGQSHYFLHFSPEDIPLAKDRYINETKRLYNVLNIGLTDRDWLAGPGRGTFSIADANVVPWIRIHVRAGVPTLDEWPHLSAWFTRCMARPSIQAAIQSVAP